MSEILEVVLNCIFARREKSYQYQHHHHISINGSLSLIQYLEFLHGCFRKWLILVRRIEWSNRHLSTSKIEGGTRNLNLTIDPSPLSSSISILQCSGSFAFHQYLEFKDSSQTVLKVCRCYFRWLFIHYLLYWELSGLSVEYWYWY